MKKLFFVVISFLMLSVNAYALELEYQIEPQYGYSEDFYKGLAKVSKDGETAIINKDGEIIVDFSAGYKFVRANGLIMIVDENDKAGFFNKNGEQVTDYIYDVFAYSHSKTDQKNYYFPFVGHDGDGKSDLIPVSRDGKFGYINSKGEEEIPLELDYCYGFYGGFAIIASESTLSMYGTYLNGKCGIIDETGNILFPANSCWNISIHNMSYRMGYDGEVLHFINSVDGVDGILFPDGVFRSYEKTVRYSGAKHVLNYDKHNNPYVIDFNIGGDGTKIIFPVGMYPEIELFGDNFIVGGVRIVNKNNETLYDLNDVLKEMGLEYGRLRIYDMDDKFAHITIPANDGVVGHVYSGLVDRQGNVILPPEYEVCYDRGEGIIYARTTEENFLFDYNGNLISKINGQLVGDFCDGVAMFLDFDTMKRGYIKNPVYPRVYINNERLVTQVYAKIYMNRVFVPMRDMFESLGAEVIWDNETQTAIGQKGDNEIRIRVGERYLYKNGETVEIDAPARIENQHILLPLRVISEALEYDVRWNQEERRVDINSTAF